MSAELIGILGVGVVLGGLVLRVSSRINVRIDGLESRLASVEQRLARVEGLIEGTALFGSRQPAQQPTGD